MMEVIVKINDQAPEKDPSIPQIYFYINNNPAAYIAKARDACQPGNVDQTDGQMSIYSPQNELNVSFYLLLKMPQRLTDSR